MLFRSVSSSGAAGLVGCWCVGGKVGGGARLCAPRRRMLRGFGGRRVEVPAQLGRWWCPELVEERAAWLCSFIVDDPGACVRWLLQPSTLFGGVLALRFVVLAVLLQLSPACECGVCVLPQICSACVFKSCICSYGE